MFDSFILFVQLSFIIFKCTLGIPLQLTTENFTVAEQLPYETQHAVCTVITKEIEATAKATITRQLKGVCSSKDINLRFDELHQELLQIKEAMGIRQQHNRYKSLNSDNAPASPLRESTTTADLPVYEHPDYSNNNKPKNKKHHRLNEISKLQEEIFAFNDTVVESSEGDLYFYYWLIADIKTLLQRKNIYISSPPFSVLGHTLHLQFYPNYLNEYIGILLKPESNSFLKKHKILFLGQRSTQNKISSKILYGIKNEEKIFRIEPKMLSNDFVSSGTLLVKVKIYLNS